MKLSHPLTNGKKYLIEQARTHPSSRPQDLIKLCYQAAFGAEHLIRNPAAAELLFNREFSAVEGSRSRLYEKISPDFCRVNLAAWKGRRLPPEWLFQMFLHSSAAPTGANTAFQRLLQDTARLCSEGAMPFSLRDWENALNTYRDAGGGAVHHSQPYRESEHPAYRLVGTRFLRLFPLLERMAGLNPQKDAIVIALDGRAASGKTTMAGLLTLILNAGVIHMDDFFLPASLRTQARLAEPGGNIHYERFAREVLPNVGKPEAFSYRRFDCAAMDFSGLRQVPASLWRVVEGAYSCHPFFHDYADLRVFCNVGPEEQMRRIRRRNGTEAAKAFAGRWIPMEEYYFSSDRIKEKADVLLSVD